MVQTLCYSRIVGQARAKRLVAKTLAGGRLPHALLFRGPDGVGKGLFAQGLAAALNCRQEGPVAACGLCQSCRKFATGNHPDYLKILPEKGAIKIDQVRQLKKEVGYPPYESRYRVVLLEDVHTMRREAANSLLKVLEEPPENNIMVLTAEASAEILPTIVSRCQLIPFVPLSGDELETLLEAKGVAEDRRGQLARLAEGSIGKAMLYEGSEILDVWQEVVSLLEEGGGDRADGIGRRLLAAERMAGLKEGVASLLQLLRIWARDRLMTVDSVGAGDKSWSSEALFATLQAIDRAEKELARNCNRSLVCEVLLFRMEQNTGDGTTVSREDGSRRG